MDDMKKASIELFTTAWQEDRAEIRSTRDRLFNLCMFIAVADFAVTAFLLGSDAGPHWRGRWLFVTMDATFILLLFVVCRILMKDLWHARAWMEKRENDVIQMLKNRETKCPFPEDAERNNWGKDSSGKVREPSISERGLWQIPILVAFAIIVKLMVVFVWSLAAP